MVPPTVSSPRAAQRIFCVHTQGASYVPEGREYLRFLERCTPERNLQNAAVTGGRSFLRAIAVPLPTAAHKYVSSHAKELMIHCLCPKFLRTRDFIRSVFSSSQAWWMTDTTSTDIWGRWVLVNKVWNLTDLPEGAHYPKGMLHTRTTDPSANSHREYHIEYWLLAPQTRMPRYKISYIYFRK